MVARATRARRCMAYRELAQHFVDRMGAGTRCPDLPETTPAGAGLEPSSKELHSQDAPSHKTGPLRAGVLMWADVFAYSIRVSHSRSICVQFQWAVRGRAGH